MGRGKLWGGAKARNLFCFHRFLEEALLYINIGSFVLRVPLFLRVGDPARHPLVIRPPQAVLEQPGSYALKAKARVGPCRSLSFPRWQSVVGPWPQASAGHSGPYKKTNTLAARGLASSLAEDTGRQPEPQECDGGLECPMMA